MAFRRSSKKQPGPSSLPLTFSPPLAMQQSLWDSIVSGNFIDAKIFAFSRRSRQPGRVDTPKALFVNTHVLATACSYFQSTFSFSDGIEIGLKGGLPPEVESFFDLEESDSDSDFDGPLEDDPAESQPQASPNVPQPPQRTVQAYVVKYTSYRTLRAIIWYIYSGEISFSDDSLEIPTASAKSVYRFADEHRMDHLKTLASEAIKSSISQLSPSQLVEEAFSVFTSRYPEWSRVYAERLPPALSRDWAAKCAFRDKSFDYFFGKLPHHKEIITSTLLYHLDDPAIRNTCDKPMNDHSVISKVSSPWPNGTKDILRTSLDSGTLHNSEFSIWGGPAAAMCPVRLPPSLVDNETWTRAKIFLASGLSLPTWQALAYYVYTGRITFKPLGSKNTEPSVGQNPSDPRFRGYPCSMKEMYNLASQLQLRELMDLVTTEMLSSLTLENVVEEMFSGLPLPSEVIKQGANIMRNSGGRSERGAHSQLREMLEKAADGSRSRDAVAFSACLNNLF